MRRGIRGGRVLLHSGAVEETDLAVEDGVVAAIGDLAGCETVIDATGHTVAPGIVDTHGDGFEQHIQPRPGVNMALDIALAEADRQFVANGVTTGFLAQSYSWEGGLRGADHCRGIIDWLSTNRARLACDIRIQIRYELFNLDGLEEMLGWMRGGAVDMVVLNDHLADYENELDDPQAMEFWAARALCTVPELAARIRKMRAREGEVPALVQTLCAEGAANGVQIGSHDDATPEIRQDYCDKGATLAEFPLTLQTARHARGLGNPVVMGAPNVVRGGSTNGNVSAASVVLDGSCTSLCSDYFVPALLHAPFALMRDHGLGFGEAWPLVSTGAAMAAGLDDRGAIALGQRADLVFLEGAETPRPKVAATMVAGRLVHAGAGFVS